MERSSISHLSMLALMTNLIEMNWDFTICSYGKVMVWWGMEVLPSIESLIVSKSMATNHSKDLQEEVWVRDKRNLTENSHRCISLWRTLLKEWKSKTFSGSPTGIGEWEKVKSIEIMFSPLWWCSPIKKSLEIHVTEGTTSLQIASKHLSKNHSTSCK